jgi:hypothetical protein
MMTTGPKMCARVSWSAPADARATYLVLRDPGILIHVEEDGRLDEAAGLVKGFATEGERALGLARRDVLQDGIELRLVCARR